MASIPYETIYESFLGNVTDVSLANLSEDDLYELLTEYLHKSVSQPYVYSLFSVIELDDSTETLTYTMEYPIDENVDLNFVIYILGKAMVLEWISPQVRSTVNILQMYSGKEQKFYSQSAHISELRQMQSDIESEIRHRIMDRGYIFNAYLEV